MLRVSTLVLFHYDSACVLRLLYYGHTTTKVVAGGELCQLVHAHSLTTTTAGQFQWCQLQALTTPTDGQVLTYHFLLVSIVLCSRK